MAFTVTHQNNWSTGGRSIDNSKQYSSGSLVSVDESISDSETDKDVDIAFDLTQVKSLYMSSDQDMLVEGNDGAGAAGSVNLKANVPYIWTTDSYDAIKFSVDITSLFCTNASGSAAQFKVEVLVDPTA